VGGDFGYFARMQIVSYSKFQTIKDGTGQTLNDRMQTRMATQTLFDVYVAKTGWSDSDKEYRDTTPLYWGAQSNQYIEIQEACEETKRNSNNTKTTSNKCLAC